MTRALSLAALTVLELSPPQMVACAADAGYAHVGLRLLPATDNEPTWPVIGDTPMVRELERRLADSGVRTLDIEIFRLRPETDTRSYLPALETGARLGARHVLVAGNDPDEVRLTERFAELCNLGAPLGLTFDLEPMPWTDVKNLQQGARIAESSRQENAGVLIDPIHFDRGGNVPADIAAVPPRRLHYAQLCDAPAERPRDLQTLLHQARAERLMPGDGGLDLAGILRALPATLPLAVEVPLLTLAKTVPAVERARRIRVKTEALLATL
ncbi:MAG TPA: sugar phosphate isomerase/epimerase [Casimicrobiaceae bacterium]|jgi:sugar phosphate isomerase/epimerase|nr:sugar phosphate isomerase/epimerase [Casimicrobiaceae bacterium]